MPKNVGHIALAQSALQIEPPCWLGSMPMLAGLADRYEFVWRGEYNGIAILARRDGFVFFDFDGNSIYSGGQVPECEINYGERIPARVTDAEAAREQLIYRRIAFMNAYLFLLYSCFGTIQATATSSQNAVSPKNYFVAQCVDGVLQLVTNFSGKVNYPIDRTTIVRIDTLAGVIPILDACQNRFGPDSVILLQLAQLASNSHCEHQFASSLVISWSIAEKIITHIWSDFLKDNELANGGHTKISKERRKILQSHDYTASIISQTLSLSKRLTDDELQNIDFVRKKRNGFVHNLSEITSYDSQKAIQLVVELLTRELGTQVTFQTGLSFLG